MKPRINIITLGVSDLEKSFAFYHLGLGLPSKNGLEGDGELRIAFFQLQGTMLALFPRKYMANYVNLESDGRGFPGFCLGHFLETPGEVDKTIAQCLSAGAMLSSPAQRREWGGYSGYIKDPDGYYWEILFLDKGIPNDLS